MEGPPLRHDISEKRKANLFEEDHGRLGQKDTNCSRLNNDICGLYADNDGYGKDISDDKPAKQPKGSRFVKGDANNAYADSKGGISQIVDFPQQSERGVNGQVAFKGCKAGTPQIVDYTQQKGGYTVKNKQGAGKANIQYAFIGSLFGNNGFTLGPSQPSLAEPTQPEETGDGHEDEENSDEEPVGNQEQEPEGVQHARSLVNHAETLYESISESIKVANERLKALNNARVGVPDELIEDLRATLTHRVRLLYDTIETREDALKALQQKDEEQRITILELQEELSKANKAQKPGLSNFVKNQLNEWGYKDVDEMVYKHIRLQDRVQVIERSWKETTLSPAASRLSIQEECHKRQLMNQENQGRLTSFNSNGVTVPQNRVSLPMPEKFTGKTRKELERFFKLYEASSESKGWSDGDRATFLGSYMPKLVVYHDNLRERGATYTEMKRELLSTLGSDGAISMFYLRTELDRVKKSPGKFYKSLLEDIELRVTEAYGNDVDARENELKKILLRLTEEDSDPVYRSIVLTNVTASYYQLKELVLGIESSQSFKSKGERPEVKSSNNFKKPFYQGRSDNRENVGEQEKPRGFSESQQQRDWNQHRAGNGGYEQRAYHPPDVRTCYICRKQGHIATDCTERTTGGANIVDLEDMKAYVSGITEVGNTEADTVVSEPMFGKQSLLDIWCDGVKVSALMDSGASTSVIKDTVVGHILRARDKDGSSIVQLPRESYAHKKLYGADGKPLTVVNCVQMPIAWGDGPTKLAKFFVIRGLKKDALIGTNVIQDDDNWINALTFSLKRKEASVAHLGVIKVIDVSSNEDDNQGNGQRGIKKKDKSDTTDLIEPHDNTVMGDTVGWMKTFDNFLFEVQAVQDNVRDSEEADPKTPFGCETVVVGGTNASKFARANGLKQWSLKALYDYCIRYKAIFGTMVKKVIYFPSGEELFRRGAEFVDIVNGLLMDMDQMAGFMNVEVIVLPIFRHFGYGKLSEKLISWYNEWNPPLI
uniref:CCHC-type domain-containing protein n=1 Tax=Panagrolaimus davidi TaxID=227884 RepID=A0A914Q4B3_9BILA